MGRTLMIIGGAVFVVGLLVSLGVKLRALGRLPGDLVWRRGGTTIYLPLATSLVLSLLLTLLFALLRR